MMKQQKIVIESPDGTQEMTFHLVLATQLDVLPLYYQSIQLQEIPGKIFVSTLKWKSWKLQPVGRPQMAWLHRHVQTWHPGKMADHHDERVRKLIELEAVTS